MKFNRYYLSKMKYLKLIFILLFIIFIQRTLFSEYNIKVDINKNVKDRFREFERPFIIDTISTNIRSATNNAIIKYQNSKANISNSDIVSAIDAYLRRFDDSQPNSTELIINYDWDPVMCNFYQ